MSKKWYVLHCLSTHEQKAQLFIEKNIKYFKMEDLIGQVLVPTQEKLGLRSGKKVITNRKILPSYILIEMELTDASSAFVNDVPGITGFVGNSHRPVPLKKEELDRIMNHVENKRGESGGSDDGVSPYHVDDKVKVVSGPFSDFTGTIDQVSPEKSKVKVVVSIFGRPTSIELDFLQIEMSNSDN